MPITPALITWARERAGYTVEDVAKRQRKIATWESGEAYPTYPQLVALSKLFRVPAAVFFFPEPPDIPPLKKSFRTLGSELFDEIPPRIRLLVEKAGAYQLVLGKLYDGRNPSRRLITRDLRINPDASAAEIASTVREFLEVPVEKQFEWPDDGCETAFKEWRAALWGAGVYVFKDQFRQADYSGFCLYNEEFPVIYVNNTTPKTRQVFTLFHELGHLLFETSGVATAEEGSLDRMSPRHRRIEVTCNRLAAQVLVPDSAFDRALAGADASEEGAARLASRFKVSREMIYRRFLDRKLISRAAYDAASRRWTDQVRRRSDGGNPYNTKIAYLGHEFIDRAFSRYYQHRITESQLADYLDIKPRYLSALEQYVTG